MAILKSRFHKPKITSNLIRRERIINLLNQFSEKPLVLVSAPAGYGKSTVVSHWLETQQKPYTWLSMDYIFDNFTIFLEYFAEALRSFPQLQNRNIQDFVEASSVLSPQAIAEKVCIYLNENISPGILVLDDYNKIKNDAIHEFINFILSFPPINKQLVIITRL